MIGVSTLAFGTLSREDIVKIAQDNNWTIEFSSSFPFLPDMSDFFTSIHINRLAHNYFPAPERPFVLNLASQNTKIRNQSIQHCLKGLEISLRAGAGCFSAHAGFCIDPEPQQLGNKLDVNKSIDRDLSWNLFIDSIIIILRAAKELGMSFYIENNVVAQHNLRNDGQEVLFCCRAEEMIKLVDIIDCENFGILLDSAHLKVSSQTLNFDLDIAVDKLLPHVRYIHHSDNDGTKDSNESIGPNYWFLKWMNKFKQQIHILEVKNLETEKIRAQLALLKSYGEK